jgi:hypothetical protein
VQACTNATIGELILKDSWEPPPLDYDDVRSPEDRTLAAVTNSLSLRLGKIREAFEKGYNSIDEQSFQVHGLDSRSICFNQDWVEGLPDHRRYLAAAAAVVIVVLMQKAWDSGYLEAVNDTATATEEGKARTVTAAADY